MLINSCFIQLLEYLVSLLQDLFPDNYVHSVEGEEAGSTIVGEHMGIEPGTLGTQLGTPYFVSSNSKAY